MIDTGQRRWASRKEALTYARVGATKMNTLLQSQAILAKKDGRKVIVDLDSIDRYYESLPNVGEPVRPSAGPG
jgi:hypothetical protein